MTSALGLKLQAAIETAEARKAMEDWTRPISVSEATFNAVRDNPGLSKTKICVVLEQQGYKPASTTSLLSAMLRYGIVVEADGGLRAIGDTYKTRVAFNPRLKQKGAKVKAKVEAPAPRTTIITTNFNVDAIIKNLTIYQAKELRDALNNLFK
jgi:hypothetical protein